MADIDSNLPIKDTADGTAGGPVPTVVQQVGGKDGSSNLQPIKIDSQGGVVVAGEGTAGSPTGGVISVQGVASGTAVPVSGTVVSSNLPTTVDTNFGTVGASTLRVASEIGNSTGAAAFNAGTTTAQTIRVVLPTDQTSIPSAQSGSWTVTSNAGTNLNTSALALDASVVALQASQGSTTSGQKGSLTLGAVTTAAPTYTTAQSSPLSLTTAGALRVDSSDTTQTVSGTVAATQSGTWTVQPGNTANTTPWLTTDTADGPVTPGAVAIKSQLMGGQYNTALPVLTNTQQSAIQLDSSGRIIVRNSELPSTVDTNYGAVGASTLRTASEIGNAAGAASFGAGSTDSQTLRSASNNYDGSGNPLASHLYNSQYALQTNHQDGPQLDNLHRLRISEANTIFTVSFNNSTQALLTKESLTGSATIATNNNGGSIRLTTTTSSADSAILQSGQYIRYNPGRSYSCYVSGNMGAKKVNTTQKWGLFDANDGMFFAQTSTSLNVTIRTSTSGSPVDTAVAQASWNLDKLDGTGASGVTLDTSKHNLYVIDYLWHGAGRIRFGVDIGGYIIYCHQISAGNVSAFPYTRTPTLPIRAELTNTGTVGSSTNMDIVCFVAQRESAEVADGSITFSQSRGVSTITASATAKPLIAIRPKLTYNGITNRIPVLPLNVSVLAGSQNTLVQIFLNPTLTGASFTSADPNSAVEYDQSATAISGGTAISEFYVSANSGFLSTSAGVSGQTLSGITLGLNVAGSTADIFCVVVTSLAGGSNTIGAITWEEFQ